MDIERKAMELFWSDPRNSDDAWNRLEVGTKNDYRKQAEELLKTYADDEKKLDGVFKKVFLSENASDDILDIEESRGGAT